MNDIKISELEETDYLQGGCCFPLVQENETKKVSFETLKNELPQTEVMVGTTTTGEPGTDASVFNSGTPTAPILNFTIPKGNPGEQGKQGVQGPRGYKGDTAHEVYVGDDSSAPSEAKLIIDSIKGTANGTDIQVTDSINDTVSKLVLDGRSTQEIRSGKNKLENNANTTTINGITFTKNEDGTISVNGTATANAVLDIGRNLTNEFNKGTYIASGCPLNGSSSTYQITLFKTLNETITSLGGDFGNGLVVSIDETCYLWERIIIYNGQTINNLIFKPMITSGSVATSYEPYGVMPSPDFPSPIESITEISAEAVGKNLFTKQGNATPKTDTTFWTGITYTTPESDGWCKVSADNTDGTATIFANQFTTRNTIDKLEVNTTYSILVEVRNLTISGSSSSSPFLQLCETASNSVWQSIQNYDLTTFKETNKVVFQKLTKTNFNSSTMDFRNFVSVPKGYKVEFEYRLMVVKGSYTIDTIGNWEEYKSNSLTIDLQNNELCSLANGTKDEANVANGKTSLVKRTKEFILDENKIIVLEKVLTNTTRFLIYNVTSSMNDYPSAISTHFKYLVDYNSDTEHFYITRNGAMYLFVNKSVASTVDEFKTWLSNNNVKFLCELAEPEIIELGEVTTLKTFNGTTYISNSKDTNMSIEYSTNAMPDIEYRTNSGALIPMLPNVATKDYVNNALKNIDPATIYLPEYEMSLPEVLASLFESFNTKNN